MPELEPEDPGDHPHMLSLTPALVLTGSVCLPLMMGLVQVPAGPASGDILTTTLLQEPTALAAIEPLGFQDSIFSTPPLMTLAMLNTDGEMPETPAPSQPSQQQERQCRVYILAAAAGLSPDALAVVMDSPQAAASVLASIDPDAPEASAFMAQLEARDTAQQQRVTTMEAARKDPTPANMAAYAQAKSAHKTVDAQINAAQMSVSALCTRNLTGEQKVRLKNARAAELEGLAPEMGLELDTPEKRAQAKIDLNLEANTQLTGEPMDENAQARLAALRSSSQVSAGKQRRESGHAVVEAGLTAAAQPKPVQ